jgi:hypothetical protein
MGKGIKLLLLVLKIVNLLIKEFISIKDSMRNTEDQSLFDKIFDSEINILIQKVDSHYSNYDYRDVINFGFFDMLRYYYLVIYLLDIKFTFIELEMNTEIDLSQMN